MFLSGDSDNENKEISSIVKDFQSKLETAQAELKSEQEKVGLCLELHLHIQHIIKENLIAFCFLVGFKGDPETCSREPEASISYHSSCSGIEGGGC